MWRATALSLASLSLAAALAVGSGDAAVSNGVNTLVRAQLNRPASTTAPARASTPQRSERTALEALQDAVVVRMNQIRRRHGLRPLRHNESLEAAALAHSRDMGRRGYFEHDSISGTPFWRRIERFYASRGFSSWTVGENLLWATDSYGAAFAVREWMHSPPHRENILSRGWREVGVGAAFFASAGGEYEGRAVTIMTADFGARR